MRTFGKLVVALALIALLGIGSLGCNTIRGAGKDIQSGGRAIENTAEDAQGK